MNSSIFTEVRLYYCNDEYYCDQSFEKILNRYLDKFGIINLFTRIVTTNNVPNGFSILKNSNLRIYDIGKLFRFIIKPLNKKYMQVIKNSDLIILRLHSIISLKVYPIIKKNKKKYLCEVMGCAFDAYWNHGFLGKIIAIPMYFFIRYIIYNSNYTIYVTEKFLQKRYPTKGITVGVSNVNINKPLKVKKYNSNINYDKINLKLFTSAALNVKYKGQQYIIKAIKQLKKNGIIIDYYLAGKGDNNYLKHIADKYGVSDNIHFLGMLDKRELFENILKADIYVQPSLQEGLPRALIEAMNLSLVCLGSNVAGIPELLDEKYIFKEKSTKDFIRCLKEILDSDFNIIGNENYVKAKSYYNDVLDDKRNNFYDYIIGDVKNEN